MKKLKKTQKQKRTVMFMNYVQNVHSTVSIVEIQCNFQQNTNDICHSIKKKKSYN